MPAFSGMAAASPSALVRVLWSATPSSKRTGGRRPECRARGPGRRRAAPAAPLRTRGVPVARTGSVVVGW
jgi:hypothetical protein